MMEHASDDSFGDKLNTSIYVKAPAVIELRPVCWTLLIRIQP